MTMIQHEQQTASAKALAGWVAVLARFRQRLLGPGRKSGARELDLAHTNPDRLPDIGLLDGRDVILERARSPIESRHLWRP